ncbi:MAG: GNAT family N-acetyltransferase [bacterium]|jgi:N-acetylglutamate synthase-like GNAT family acetyltransferase|nr:GNAT family N-acetyltransferase [bacterium]
MIRKCDKSDIDVIFEIINDSAQAYKGVIPQDRWKEPYMSKEELLHEIGAGVEFWGYEEEGQLVGVMGIQNIQDVALIRHAYVRTVKRNKGVGKELLMFLKKLAHKPMLIGTWEDAKWATYFYEKCGFQMVSSNEKEEILRKYWNIPERQAQTSVVLADQKWFDIRFREMNKGN